MSQNNKCVAIATFCVTLSTLKADGAKGRASIELLYYCLHQAPVRTQQQATKNQTKRIGLCRKLTAIVFGVVVSTNMAQLHKNTAHAGTKSLIGKIQLPDSGVLTSRVFGRSKENESDTYHVCCGKPYVTGTPFVCDSCGAIKNCNSFQDEGDQDVEASSDEFLQKIFSSTFIYFIIHCLFSSKVLFSFMICIYVTIKTSGARFIMYYGLI